jgi:hypothetical protein
MAPPPPRPPHPFLRAGVPLLGLSVGGFMFLQYFLQGRIDVQVRRCSQPAAAVLLWRAAQWLDLPAGQVPPPDSISLALSGCACTAGRTA